MINIFLAINSHRISSSQDQVLFSREYVSQYTQLFRPSMSATMSWFLVLRKCQPPGLLLIPISVTRAINKPNNFTKEKSSFCPPTVVEIENKAAKTSCTSSSEPIPCQKHIRCQPWILQYRNEFVHYGCRRGSVNAHWSRIHHRRNTLRTIRPFSRSVGIKSLPLCSPKFPTASQKFLNERAGIVQVLLVLFRAV